MVQHYRPDRRTIFRTTPKVDESNYDLVCKLRKTNGDRQKIEEVLADYARLTKKEIDHSLKELTVADNDAIIAFVAAQVLNNRTVVKRAAAIIVSSPFLSEEVKNEAEQCLHGKMPRTDILGLGIKKVRGANSRIKRN